MSELFVISDEFEKKLHPEARKLIHEWIANFQCQVQLDEVNNDDLKFLSAADIIKLKRIYEVSECLNKCVGIKDGDKLYDVYFGDIILSKGAISQLKRDLLNIEFDIVPPLKKIYEGRVAKTKKEERKKVEEAREEQRKREGEERQQTEKAKEEQRRREEKAEAERKEKEDSERWRAAYIAIKPPDDDAKKYLNDNEYEEFKRATWKAVDVYKEKGEDYLDYSGTSDYRRCLWRINYEKEREQQEIRARKEKERQQIIANLAAREFNNSLSKHIAGLKSKLNNRPRDLRNYFTTGIRDKRYTGHNFDYILDDDQERVFDATLVRLANDKLKQIIQPDLLEFIEIPSTYYRHYFPLPSISYSFEGIPCLDFNFDIFATAYGRVLLKPKEKTFGICRFNLPAEKEGNVLVPLEEPRLLGYFHVLLTPEDLDGYVPFEAIPLVLFNWLLKDGAKPAGVTISAASDGIITYKFANFKGEVTMPDKFADCLKNIGSFDDLLNMGWVSEKVANIAGSQLGESKVEQEVAPQKKDKIERKDTGKAKAFKLFDEGKRPSDRDVKATKIKPQILYRYYQEWKHLSTN